MKLNLLLPFWGVVSIFYVPSILAQSPYIDKVYDFMPAPGQFVNILPQYGYEDTKEDMIQKVEDAIAGTKQSLVSLGGYGGYVVFGFDHLVENIPGKYDFKIWSNAFWAQENPNPNAPQYGGSCEPGIVMVSYDTNENGIPDDEWYEIAGSEYNSPHTIRNYELTYYRPAKDKIPTPDNEYSFLTDTTYIKWKSNQADSGYVSKNSFHAQSYYPYWIEEDSMTFKGSKLNNNYIDESGEKNYYVQYAYGWGYADNYPNSYNRSCFSIDWAVDDSGNKVELPGIHFVKVYTGVNQYCGWLGETSTEIKGAEDLHLTGKDANIDIPELIGIRQIQNSPQDCCLLKNPVEDKLIITSNKIQQAKVYGATGNIEMAFTMEEGANYIDCALKQGIYIIKTGDQAIKFIKQ